MSLWHRVQDLVKLYLAGAGRWRHGLVAFTGVVKGIPDASVLVLCADDALRDSLIDLLVADGRRPTATPGVDGDRPAVVLAACDPWPPGWDLGRLRSTFHRIPCVVLSGSPLGGDFAVTKLQRGYFVQLPALPAEILGLVAELCDV